MAFENKLLTVIVPSYNMEAYLSNGLDSLIVPDKAMLQRLEVIVVNDGSKDRTSEIAHDFESRYPGIFRVIDKENGHYGSCINAALPVATGAFVKIMDADDSYDTRGLQELLCFISQICDNPASEIDVVISDTICVNGDGIVTGCLKIGFLEACEFSLEELVHEQIKKLWMNQVAYRTALFAKVQYRQTQGIPFTDQEWMFAPMSLVRKAFFVPATVYRYLLGREGQTVDERYYAKNFKVIRLLTLKHIDEYERCMPFATCGGRHYLRERLVSRIMLVYKRHLFVSPDSLASEKPDFIRFDSVVQAKVPELQESIGSLRLLRRVPIGLVDAWRRKQAGHPFRYWLLMDVCLPLVRLRESLRRKMVRRGAKKGASA